jgi:hypothetical protein
MGGFDAPDGLAYGLLDTGINPHEAGLGRGGDCRRGRSIEYGYGTLCDTGAIATALPIRYTKRDSYDLDFIGARRRIIGAPVLSFPLAATLV